MKKATVCITMIALSLILTILLSPYCWAVPAAPIIHTLEQADGTPFQARQWGDEWQHGWETVEGYTILFDTDYRNWVYADRDQKGKLVATDIIANSLVTLPDIPKHLRPSPKPNQYSTKSFYGGAPLKVVPSTGTANIPVILINFNDRFTTYGTSDFNNLLFGNSGSTMKRYYEEISYGKFSVSGNVVGWYTASNGHDYYGNENNPTQMTELIKEAVLAADAAGFDFSPYDNDGDGKVDVVNIIHQGAGEDASGVSTDIWSHRWALSSAGQSTIPVDGKIVDDYIIQPETYAGGSNLMTVGVFCHEFGHALGLPDLYDTDGSSEGIGSWGLMGAGSWTYVSRPGDSPAHMCAWSKWFLGWVTPTRITSPTSISILQVETTPQVYQILDNPNGVDWRNGSSGTGEYFLLENRQRTGFDAGLPGSGLLIWHIDESRPGTNKANADESRKLVDLEEADGLAHLDNKTNRGDSGDPYPGSSINRTFDMTSNPNSNLYSGAQSGVRIQNISDSASTMNASINFVEEVVVPVNLSFFVAESGDSTIGLFWRTESEIDNYGWNIYRASGAEGGHIKINPSIIPGAGSSSSAYNYSYIDKGLRNGTTYNYYLEDIDLKGEAHQNRSFLAHATPYEGAPPIALGASKERDEGLSPPEISPQTPYSLKPKLSSASRVKILVDKQGLYRVSYQDLLRVGIDPSSIRPRDLRLTNKGRLIPLTIQGGEDGIFGKKDYLEFEGDFNRGTYTYEDIYTRNNVYWLSWDRSEELIGRIDPIIEEEYFPKIGMPYQETLHLEEDRVYSPLGYAPDGQRDHWFWRVLDAPGSASFSFRLEGPLATAKSYLLKLRLQGNSHPVYFPDHKAGVYLNDIMVEEAEWDGQEDYILSRFIPREYLVEGGNILRIEAIGTGEGIDSFFFDWLEVSYPRDSMPKKELLRPLAIVPDNPSALRSPSHQAEYLIITHKDFWEQASALASHQETRGLKAKVVDITGIYDEFSHGIFSPEAIREFLRYTYNSWQKPAPQYVLLLGGANIDYKDNSRSGIKNYVPTYPYFSRGYGQTASDHWFVCLEGDDAKAEMSMGRLPARTPKEAQIMVNKIANFSVRSSGGSEWKNRVLFINGGYDPFDEQFFDTSSEDLIGKYLNDEYEALRIYSQPSQEGLLSYQGSTREIEEQLNNGVGLVNFLGHGAMKTWDLMFRPQDIARLRNGGRLPFVLSMTCFAGDFANKITSQVNDVPYLVNSQGLQALSSTPPFSIQPEIGDGFGEVFMKQEEGGAIAFWGTTALGRILGDSYLNEELFRALFIEKVGSIGKAIDMAKERVLTKYPNYQDLIYTFVLLGDPALDLALGW